MTARKGASRREILQVTAAGAVGLGLSSMLPKTGSSRGSRATIADAAPPRIEPEADAHAAVDDGGGYLADLVGKHLGRYRVISVGGLDRGGIPVVMSTTSGVRFRVDVLRFDPTAGRKGIGPASSVSVYLRNGGNGRTSTDEIQGLGAMALAGAIAKRERAGLVPPSGLLTMDERAAYDASLT